MKHENNKSSYYKPSHYQSEDMLYEEKRILKPRRASALKLMGVSLGFVIAIVLLYIAARVFFRVENITVENNSIYSDEQIIKNFSVNEGDFLFSFSSSEAEKELCMKLPYIDKIDIRRVYPSTVEIKVEELQARYMCVQKNKYIVFSPDLKVLEVSDENKWADTVVTVELPDVRRAIEGEIIEFSGVEKTEYISGFIKSLGNFKGDTKIDKIYLSDYFNIKMLCENRYMISFGKYDAIDVKMHTLEKVIESKTVSESAAATIDISDPKEPRVIPYDRADAIS